MSRLPAGLSRLIAEVISWIDANKAQALPSDTVPGASAEELQRLATLGAVARALATDAVPKWPASLARWAQAPDVEFPAELTAASKEAIDAEGFDFLAKIYELLVSGRNRRRLGTFFTPPPIVTYMVGQATALGKEQPACVVDPGAGVGAFTTAARDTWPDAQILSVDLNVVTLGLLATRDAVERSSDDSRSPRNNVELIHKDYLAWLNDDWPEATPPRLILGNPPYTRHQEMPAASKAAARIAAGALITSGLAGLSAYFVAATLLSLGKSDRMVLLLPGSWLETRYGREIREWLWYSRRRRVELDLFPSQVEVFPGTQVTAMILSVGPERRSKQPFMARTVDLRTGSGGVAVERLAEVRPERDASCPSTFTRFLGTHQKPQQHDILNLGSVANIRRGVATGANHFFFLSDLKRQERGLTERVLRPALVKAAHCPGAILTDVAHKALDSSALPRWLLDLNGCNIEHEDALKAYLEEGIAAEVPRAHLAIKRRVWHTVEVVQPPDIFIAPVGKGNHRVIVNEVRAVGSNNLYGIYLKENAPWNAEYLANWLMGPTGQASLRALAREYQGGSSKIEPKSLRSLEVPEKLPPPPTIA
ncbi:Eco57I restriction-modification methylase domain-containing protein [Micromonospora zamorensis]|uniref:Eco57I restriction-modification methylase domain-containing protein n=1 Tax=Micromonospora zamorensis TaxID=709883 RepID=UPI0012FD3D4B|nr:Eco57I restriction-modification methylase domain-containing protein [Micromonospora zamorensis]